MVQIKWVANPFRGDKFEAAWRPAAEAVLELRRELVGVPARRRTAGSTSSSSPCSPTRRDFDRYWYSEEIAEARALAQGLYQVPVLPSYWEVSGIGALQPEDVLS